MTCCPVLRRHGADPGRIAQVGGDDGVDQPIQGDAVHTHLIVGIVAGADAGDHSQAGGAPGLPQAGGFCRFQLFQYYISPPAL